MGKKQVFYTVEEIRERLSISTLVFWRYQPLGERALRECARLGIRKIELLQSPEQYDMADASSMRLIAETCRECGVELSAYHAHMTHFSNIDTEADRVARVDLCRRQIDTMLDVGGTLWASHVGVADPTALRSYEELARHVEGTPALIGIENSTGERTRLKDRVAFVDEIDHPKVGMLLDIGHVRDSNGENPMTHPGGPTQVLEQCGKRLFHVHLHGFRDAADHHPPLVQGDLVHWVELFRMLRALGYAGDMNFEPAGEPRDTGSLEAVGAVPERIVQLEAQSP